MSQANQETGTNDNQKPKGDEPALCKYLHTAAKHQASDLHLKANSKPRIRLATQIRVLTGETLSSQHIENLAFELMSPKLIEQFKTKGAADFAYALSDGDRFRINLFKQRGLTSLAARRIVRIIPSFDELNLPAQFQKIAEYRQGFVLLSGITGSGKSTSIAAMIDYINNTRACHVVTIEDPIEYIFEDKKAFINQREIGLDVENFADALKHLMRQDPDVVLVGELRDYETFSAALQAAETGHLVFGTVHSSTTSQTITRILDLFPADERGLVRQSLVFNLKAIVSQKLLPSIKPDTALVPAVEIMLSTPATRKLIDEGRDIEIIDVIREGHHDGMQDFVESLRQLVEKEWIEHSVAYEAAPNPEELRMRLKGIKTGGGSISR